MRDIGSQTVNLITASPRDPKDCKLMVSSGERLLAILDIDMVADQEGAAADPEGADADQGGAGAGQKGSAAEQWSSAGTGSTCGKVIWI